jgi:hypothetical protein
LVGLGGVLMVVYRAASSSQRRWYPWIQASFKPILKFDVVVVDRWSLRDFSLLCDLLYCTPSVQLSTVLTEEKRATTLIANGVTFWPLEGRVETWMWNRIPNPITMIKPKNLRHSQSF